MKPHITPFRHGWEVRGSPCSNQLYCNRKPQGTLHRSTYRHMQKKKLAQFWMNLRTNSMVNWLSSIHQVPFILLWANGNEVQVALGLVASKRDAV